MDDEQRRGWRVGHRGRDQMFYEEWHDGRWERMEIDGEMLTGRAHHVIYFTAPGHWGKFPAWAQGRRDEIIARIKSEFREPDYEYHEPGDTPPPATEPAPARAPVAPTPSPKRPVQGMGALLLAIVLFAAVGAATTWMTVRGVSTGVTTLPLKRATLRRPVVRTQEPATYWLSMTIYAGISVGAIGATAWLMRERRRLRRG